MLFSSLTFLFGFLPVVVIIYFLIKNRSIKNFVLLIFSLLFYSWGEPKYIILIIVTIFVAYIIGLFIHKFDTNKKTFVKKLSLIIGIVLIIGNLVFFKYIDFIIDNFNIIFNSKIENLNILLPIGISFYTFQILSYLIDLYKNKIKVQKNVLSLALYVSFFPQLIAGPIVRYQTIEDEINNRKENIDDVIKGSKRFIIGLSKKVIIANQLALIADTIFNNFSTTPGYGTSIIWLGILAYTLQIYFDFSGYSDMAIGLGKIFGFHFLENFNYPYIATSITDFWRRWHISLSSWFRDYIYIPLGGNRKGIVKQIRNILIVWGLTGLWHGAAWNFIIWGLYYALFLLLEKLLLNKIFPKISNTIKWIYTIIIVMIGWMIFRANNLADLVNLFEMIFIYTKTDWLTILANDVSIFNGIILIVPAIILSFPILPKLNVKYSNNFYFILIKNLILLILFFICVVLLTSSSYNPFIYFRF